MRFLRNYIFFFACITQINSMQLTLFPTADQLIRIGEEHYFKKSNFREAFLTFTKVLRCNEHAPWSFAAAQVYLGSMLVQGQGVEKDHAKAQVHLLKAFNQESNRPAKFSAAIWLGQIYTFGFLGNKDYEKAYEYFKIASEQNTVASIQAAGLVLLGQLLFEGGGNIKKNYKEAYRLFNLAVAINEPWPQALACAYLGIMHGNIAYISQPNEKLANDFLNKALNQMINPEAQSIAAKHRLKSPGPHGTLRTIVVSDSD